MKLAIGVGINEEDWFMTILDLRHLNLPAKTSVVNTFSTDIPEHLATVS